MLKVVAEAGHGMSYRTKGEMDYGCLLESGATEHDISKQYALRFAWAVKNTYKGSREKTIAAGTIAQRLQHSLRYKADVIVSFHLNYDVEALPGARVRYFTAGSKKLAYALADSLGIFAVYAVPQAEGLLAYDRSVEIELGNVASQQDVKNLLSIEHCLATAQKLADALASEFDTVVRLDVGRTTPASLVCV